MASKPENELPPPQIEEALRRIAECKRSRAEELDLGGLHLREIPEQVAELTWLKQFYCALGADVQKKRSLGEEDKKSSNAVRALPARVLAALQHLEELDLRHNQLAALPPDIGRLTALTTLLLDGNQLAALPPDIGRLRALTHLSLDGNRLAELPPEIDRLTALMSLSLDKNQLAVLPTDIGRLRALTHLSLYGNKLTSLPPEIGCLTALTKLALHYNQLAELPPEIGRLTDLTKLTLGHNRLTALPPEIGRLTNLTELRIHSNKLSTLLPEIGHLTALTILSPEDNQITALPPEIGRLTALTELWMGKNKLRVLPPEIGQLTRLAILWLGGNQITALPPEIGRLTALTRLMLAGNRLTALPPEIGHLTALTELELTKNPLQSPPPEVVKQGLDAIRSFLNAAAQTGRPAYEAKVVLVGEAGVGKTQLREWMLAAEFREPGLSTRLLEVRACSIDNPHNPSQPGRLNIWDFGGQDDYRPSQQLFFTDGALYLMLFNGRKGLADGRVEEWLRLIRLRVGKHARVLLVATNALPTDVSPNLNELPRDLLNMCIRQADGRPFQINSKADKDRPISGLTGADGLLALIYREATALPAFKAEWPAEWLAARDAVLDPKSYSRDESGGKRVPSAIWFDQFHEIAKAHGVLEDQILILARALSDSGRLTYKGSAEAPNQLVVLDSEWLMKAIGYVLAAPEVKATGGVLQRNHLKRIWVTHEGLARKEGPTVYPENVHDNLLRQMTQHDISYRLDEDRWLIGQCVRDTMPAPMPWRFPERGAGGTVLGLSCQLTDKIHGLTSLLTVRNHYHHVNHREHAWQRGVFLRHPLQNAEAVIRVDGERRVDIETRGPDAGPFISELKGSLDKIIADTWRAAAEAEVKPYRYAVPCPKCEHGSYGYDDLRADFREGETTAKCENGKRCTNDISTLLEGFSRAADLDPTTRALLRATSNEPPHIITVTKVPRPLRLGQNVRVDVHCEYTERIVEGATETIALDNELWVKLKEWGPGLFIAGVKVWIGLDPSIRKRQGVRQNEDLADAVEKTGRLERAPNTFIETAFGEFLAKTARKGGMTQIEMNNDGRLLWVAPDVARGQDPNRPKSQRSGKV
jgi:internalin A